MTPRSGHYAELNPDEMEAILELTPAVYAPWGALEWHGAHLPLGLDGLVAEAVCRRAAAISGGVVLPTTWWAITTLPHRFSLTTPDQLVVELWRDLFRRLAGVGFRVIVVVTGHYAQAHDLLLMDAADAGMDETSALILAAPELAVLTDESRLDHAARWETSSLLAIRPDLVRLDRLDRETPEGTADLARFAVLGADPRPTATPAQGEAMLNQAAAVWAKWVSELLTRPDAERVRAFHAQRRAAYQSYIEQYYRGDWDEALHAWWRRRLGTTDEHG